MDKYDLHEMTYIEIDKLIKSLELEIDRWKKTAETLASELGKKEYASAEYENQKDSNG